jgi:HK97 family phage prohead protease
MDHLIAPFEVKARSDSARTFEGLAAAFSLDLGGDVIHPGAFTKSLSTWKGGGQVIPLLDMHAPKLNPTHSVTRHTLGKLVDAEEVKEGLWSKFQVARTTAGQDLMALLEDGMVEALSVGFNPVGAKRDAKGIRHISDLVLGEISVVTFGMNTDALIDLESVKSMLVGMEPGSLSKAERAELRRLASRIGSLLRSAPPAQAAVAPKELETIPPDPPPVSADAVKAKPDDEESKALLERITTILGRNES